MSFLYLFHFPRELSIDRCKNFANCPRVTSISGWNLPSPVPTATLLDCNALIASLAQWFSGISVNVCGCFVFNSYAFVKICANSARVSVSFGRKFPFSSPLKCQSLLSVKFRKGTLLISH